MKGEIDGPVATKTNLGWVVSGPIEGVLCEENTHAFRIEAESLMEDSPDSSYPVINQLAKFWEVESLSTPERIPDKQFETDIAFPDDHYEVEMSFKEEDPILPDNYSVAKSRLNSLLKRLKANLNLAKQYNNVIQDQLEKGFQEKVDLNEPVEVGKVTYLPHEMVLREDKDTTKLRVVFDSSFERKEPSLNDCLYAGPSLLPSLFDILMRFRIKKTVLLSDIEKAFLNVSIDPSQRDYLRFLWVNDIEQDNRAIIVLRYTRVVFGVI